ncbi:formate dehydrogenase subunit delta [Thalassotalea sp. ND16A]|uniref:formate dehydrogenase subunit delta n=1 Tax=Thalassotalea sp. ND16A TaxID=1535422 RepID=UPI000519F483|nr:formate dehydrogenase subunit delta [Thalassotalea sp. ND16A]KGJ95981.1 hypothetical protein ND16A_1160 [Thalassotalea sp. ND16A]
MLSLKLQNLIKMLNQIAANICLAGDEQQAAVEVAHHIVAFWAKSMKVDVIEYYQSDGEQLLPVSKQALDILIANT